MSQNTDPSALPIRKLPEGWYEIVLPSAELATAVSRELYKLSRPNSVSEAGDTKFLFGVNELPDGRATLVVDPTMELPIHPTVAVEISGVNDGGRLRTEFTTILWLLQSDQSNFKGVSQALNIISSGGRHTISDIFSGLKLNILDDNSNCPEIPSPGPGLHVELDSTGSISFAPPSDLDREGNNIRRLRGLHPDLRSLARDLVNCLAAGNRPHSDLLQRAQAYAALIDQRLEDVNFHRLFLHGVRLSNCSATTRSAIFSRCQ